MRLPKRRSTASCVKQSPIRSGQNSWRLPPATPRLQHKSLHEPPCPIARDLWMPTRGGVFVVTTQRAKTAIDRHGESDLMQFALRWSANLLLELTCARLI